MTELKTLKDLNRCPDCKAKHKPKYVQEYDLRAEAIKWIKEFKFRESYQEHDMKEKGSLIHSTDFIKHFFNITEEDLQ